MFFEIEMIRKRLMIRVRRLQQLRQKSLIEDVEVFKFFWYIICHTKDSCGSGGTKSITSAPWID